MPIIPCVLILRIILLQTTIGMYNFYAKIQKLGKLARIILSIPRASASPAPRKFHLYRCERYIVHS